MVQGSIRGFVASDELTELPRYEFTASPFYCVAVFFPCRFIASPFYCVTVLTCHRLASLEGGDACGFCFTDRDRKPTVSHVELRNRETLCSWIFREFL